MFQLFMFMYAAFFFCYSPLLSRVICFVSRYEIPISLLTFVSHDRISRDETPLPPKAATEEEDEALLDDYPIVEPGIRADYGYNVRCVHLSNQSPFIPSAHQN